MAEKDKPYKLYRGGRVKGPVRPEKPRAEPRAERDGAQRKLPKLRRPRRLRRALVLFLVGLIVLALVWALLGYLAVRRGVNAANDRLDDRAKRALTPSNGAILSNATTTLVIGSDNGGRRKDRQGVGRADTIMLVRTDPDEHRVAYLYVPRDLRVEIPGHGMDKINAAFALGGPGLVIDTVERLTGPALEVNHVTVVNFGSFREVVDALGGITIDNPEPVLTHIECPYRGAERCARFKGWRFPRGRIELDGMRALIYARVRKNELDPNETDVERGARAQRVVQAVEDEVVSPSGVVRMPFIGDDVVKHLATDLSAGELLQLGWVRWRAAADKTLRCRLGGDPEFVGGSAVLRSSEDNFRVIRMFLGEDAPQPPPPRQPFSPGCFSGRAGA